MKIIRIKNAVEHNDYFQCNENIVILRMDLSCAIYVIVDKDVKSGFPAAEWLTVPYLLEARPNMIRNANPLNSEFPYPVLRNPMAVYPSYHPLASLGLIEFHHG